jgi:O-antigen/teichoic acid export membrane protein
MKDIFTSYVGYGILTVANLLLGVMTARLLLPVGRGELGQVMLWPTLIGALGAFSIPDALVYFTAHRRAEPREVYASSCAIAFLMSLLLCAIALAILPRLLADLPPEARFAGYICVLYIPLGYLSTYSVGMLLGLMRYSEWNLLRVLLSVFNVAFAGLISLVFGASVLGFVVAILLANLSVTLLGAVLLARQGSFSLRPRLALMGSMLFYGALIHPSDLLALGNQRIDQILITQWLPAADYGHYLVAMAVWSAAAGLVALLGQLAFPKVAAEIESADKIRALSRYMRLATVLGLLGTISLAILAPILVRIVFGAAFALSAPVLQILGIGLAPYACRALLAQGFKALRRPKPIIIAEASVFAADLIGLAILIPRFGIVGAAAMFVLGQAFGCAVLALTLKASFGIGLRPLFVATAGDVRFVLEQLHMLRQPSPM